MGEILQHIFLMLREFARLLRVSYQEGKMKKQTYTMIGALVFGSLFAVSTARGQSTNQPLIANIPFAFSAGGETLPAGQYAVSLLSPASNQNIVSIVSLDGAHKVIVNTLPRKRQASEAGRLVFHRYADRYFIAQAWMVNGAGREIPASRTERAFQREVGANRQSVETVALSIK
jgi:hypothetical protein